MVGQPDRQSLPRDLNELEVRAQPEGHCHQRRCMGVRSQAGEAFTAGRVGLGGGWLSIWQKQLSMAAKAECLKTTDRDTNCSGLPRTEGFPRM